MKLLVHGVYDLTTLKTLSEIGIKDLAFDLRGKSPNLVPFGHLQEILKSFQSEKVYLTFEDDKETTIYSFLNLLQHHPFQFVLVFRDKQNPAYYHNFNRPFVWMFHPEGEWRSILDLPRLQAVILPLKWQSYYQTTPELWNIIEKKNLEVFLHASHFKESEPFLNNGHINLSIDLTNEVESRFRTVDQNQLKNMKIWRKLNESSTL